MSAREVRGTTTWSCRPWAIIGAKSTAAGRSDQRTTVPVWLPLIVAVTVSVTATDKATPSITGFRTVSVT
jgi:hypothetical protein